MLVCSIRGFIGGLKLGRGLVSQDGPEVAGPPAVTVAVPEDNTQDRHMVKIGLI